MKKLIIMALALVSTTAFASQNIYDNLAVEEEVLSTTRTEIVLQKSVGGLTCSRRDHIENGPSFSCELNTKSLDESAIYQAMRAEEVITESTKMQSIYEKTVSPLHCVKTQDVLAGESYHCQIKL